MPRLVLVANASNERLTRFEYPYSGQRQRMVCAAQVAVDYLARCDVTRVHEAGEAYGESVGNERGLARCRVERKTLWGPSGKKKCWRC